MYHVWKYSAGTWQYLGALTQGPFSKLLDLARSNEQFYAMAA
jgi:hypothetical protein